jgi:ABC-2 type transport system ATP-binding protein
MAARVAVDGLSLEVHAGEIFGLLGPNGAGKSTTVHLAVGLLEPDAGTILVGRDGAGGPPAPCRAAPDGPRAAGARRVRAVDRPREPAVLRAALRPAGAALARRVDEALAFVQLTERADDRAATYSGGMKRRLNLAAAIVHEPEVILLDEPTVGVDPQSRNAIFESIEALRGQGTRDRLHDPLHGRGGPAL